MKLTKLSLSVLGLTLLAGGVGAWAQGGMTVRLLGDVGTESMRRLSSSYAISPDGRHLATLAPCVPPKDNPLDDALPRVVRDGVAGPLYDKIFTCGGCVRRVEFLYSPDSAHLVYGAQRSKDWFMVVDGVEQGPYDMIDFERTTVRFSKDSKHLAYAAERDGKWCVVEDGLAGPALDGTPEEISFDATGMRLAYLVRKQEKDYYLVVDGKAGTPFDWVCEPMFSDRSSGFFTPVGSHAVEIGCAGDLWTVNVEGQKPWTVKDIGDYPEFYLTPDGALGKGIPYRGGPAIVSADLTHVAEWIERDKQSVLTLDGKDLIAYQNFGWGPGIQPDPCFSPDGTRLAAIAALPQAVDAYQPSLWQRAVILDGKEAVRSVVAGSVVFSPDSKRCAFIVGGNGALDLIVDGMHLVHVLTNDDYDEIYDYNDFVQFSSDGRHVACALGDSKGMTVFLDDKALGVAEKVAGLAFSPDRSHLCWCAKQGDVWHTIIDGVPGIEYEQPLDYYGHPVNFSFHQVFYFDAPDHVHYLVEMHPPTNGRQALYVVEESL